MQSTSGWLAIDTISWESCPVTTPGHNDGQATHRGSMLGVAGTEPQEEGPCMAPGTHAAFGDIVGIPHDVPRQAKVTDLHQLPLTDEDIPGSQVTMHTL